MLKNYINHWKNYFSLSGRMNRKDYWFSAFMTFGLILGSMAIDYLVVSKFLPIQLRGKIFPVTMLFAILSVVPGFTAQVMRMHDMDKSGWFLTVGLVPVIGPLYITIASYFFRGTKGQNRFGNDPLEPTQLVKKSVSAHDAYREAA